MLRKLVVLVASLLALQAAAAAAARLPPPNTAAAAATPHPVERRSLISGGSDAPAGRYPYMCALGRASKSADTIEKDLQVSDGGWGRRVAAARQSNRAAPLLPCSPRRS